jgi:hypothetical protein
MGEEDSISVLAILGDVVKGVANTNVLEERVASRKNTDMVFCEILLSKQSSVLE